MYGTIHRYKSMETLIFYQMFLALTVSANIKVCQNEKDCDKDSHCNSGVCQKCFSCKQLFRKGKSCVFDFNECEDCLEGFEETLVTDFSTALKPCKAVKITHYEECRKDENCPPNKYCLQNSCVKCFDCNLYNRLLPSKGCAKQFDECGACFEGFNELPVTTLINTKPCEMKSISHEIKKNEMFFFFKENKVVFSCVVVALFILIVFWIAKFKKKKTDNSECDPLKIEYNDSYELNLPSAPILENDEAGMCLFNDAFPLKSNSLPKCQEDKYSHMSLVNEGMQFARVYQQPTAPYYFFPVERENNNPAVRVQGDGNTYNNGVISNDDISNSSIQSINATDYSSVPNSFNNSNEESPAEQIQQRSNDTTEEH